MQLKNSEFLLAVYSNLDAGTHGWVCTFRFDPAQAEQSVWAGRTYKCQPQQALLIDRTQDDNAYFCTAVLGVSDEGDVARRKSAFRRLAVLLADDVQLADLTGTPTYVIETSPGKYQAGICIDPLDEDASDASLIDAVMHALAEAGRSNDTSGNSRVRYGRLPVASNTKARPTGVFSTRLEQWRSDQVLSLADACSVLGLDLDAIKDKKSAPLERSEYRPDPAVRSAIGVAEGGRDEAIYKYACSMRARDFDYAEAQVLVLNKAATCSPPFPPAEAIIKLNSAWTKPAGKSPEFRKLTVIESETGEIFQGKVRELECFSASSLQPASNSEVFDDELVEGVVGKAAMAVLYGDSNSGKTFLAIDLCASIAQGVQWLGRHTVPGVVLYLATESPASVEMRLRAYQRHHKVQLHRFYVVASPVSLFNVQADLEAVMHTVRGVEQQAGSPVSLIIGDTLARLSAGANENSGEDMGVVLQNCDRIRDASGATFLLIHHTGKDAAKGMRGWSGMRAHIDTEIEVTADDATGSRCAEITKQRDLDGKGDRYGFKLEGVTVGVNRWGKLRTSCVVVAADAPVKKGGKAAKMGPVEVSVLQHLRSLPAGTLISRVVSHFQEQQINRTSVYRAIGGLEGKGMAHVAKESRMVCVAEAFR